MGRVPTPIEFRKPLSIAFPRAPFNSDGVMVATLVPLLFVFLISADALKDIVIERPKNLDVDFADLLLEYNPSIPPEVVAPVEVSVSLTLLHANYDKNLLCLTVILNQTWTDHRLSVAGPLGIPVPVKYASIIWKPTTHFINDISEKGSLFLKALHLDKNGAVTSEQKLALNIPCKFDFPEVIEKNGWANCSLDMEAFGWSSHVHYRLEGIQFSSEIAKVVRLREGVEDLQKGNATAVLSIPIEVNTGITKDVLQYIVNSKILK
ncbi:hypothetical protein QR680_004773 [Steinernema hermaphroditum]|uniref:Neurotransmitter-gated ion-channel ligand-binding domain-containing protein n=1 Tax=Steinernema hermaphroditum TaxID=289476 RepID=A0AA39HRZ1_9BILA|nr:hypothetical protein QR680_004773 [Steinernema hermaphroditum]